MCDQLESVSIPSFLGYLFPRNSWRTYKNIEREEAREGSDDEMWEIL
jgi:hypothetical protein